MNCVFCKIRDREISKDFLYEDKDVMVFPDINPLKPVHILVVPKIHMKDFLEFSDKNLFLKVKTAIDKVIKSQKLNNKGYRVSVNGGGAQIVDHLHFHITGPIERSMEV
ncbi:MAG: HIT domain-containing protein [Patescibacteria group bacterium]|nr:HIT domain-containing protein [Patescibacteria group bacterium]